MNRILHVMVLEKKFTLPLYEYITQELKLKNHFFLFIPQENEYPERIGIQAEFLRRPIKNHPIFNIQKFYRLCNVADKIIVHAAPLPYFFILFPKFIKKVYWAINGGIDIPLAESEKWLEQRVFTNIDLVYKKRIPYHLSHVEEDSILVNQRLKINAKFIYSPVYLSNVAQTNNFVLPLLNDKVNVMVGNSTDPSNHHFEAFDLIYPHSEQINRVYCILSYGKYDDHKEKVINYGQKLFGDKFVPIENFMPIEDYNRFLQTIDVVVFNHRRQQAMGVTINLLSLGKVVYMNTETTAFTSFFKRGFAVFNIDELKYVSINQKRDVQSNKSLIEKYYSLNVLDNFWINI